MIKWILQSTKIGHVYSQNLPSLMTTSPLILPISDASVVDPIGVLNKKVPLGFGRLPKYQIMATMKEILERSWHQ